MRKCGESKTTRIMMATVPHVTSGLGVRKFQADGFLLTRVYNESVHSMECTLSLYLDFVLSWSDEGFLQPKHVAKTLKHDIVKLLINICCF